MTLLLLIEVIALAWCVWGLADCRHRDLVIASIERRIDHNRRMIQENAEQIARRGHAKC